MKKTPIAAALLIAAGAAIVPAAHADPTSVTLYGNIDEYGNYMKSSSGAHILSMEDGALLRSRWGLRGNEDIGGGYNVTFRLEGGFNVDNGTSATAGSLFDRQTYVGLVVPGVGEFRGGRQNGPIQTRGAFIDYTARDLGSMINNFGVPSRYDNDVSFISNRFGGLQVEGHAAIPEAAVGNHAVVYQLGLDYVSDSFRVGYLGLRGLPPSQAKIDKSVVYDNVYANWMYGKGTVYLAYVHSNNNTANATSNNAGAILGNSGGYNAGTNADLSHFYDIWQASVDYQVSTQLRVGALWGKIDDKSGRSRGATGGSIGAYYDLSKRTTLLALADTIHNDTNAGWRPAGSGGLKSNFTGSDANGRRIDGVQLGVVHKF
jgi:predicted porin